MIDLGQPAIGALDLVEGRATLEAQGAVRVGFDCHRQMLRSGRSAAGGRPSADELTHWRELELGDRLGTDTSVWVEDGRAVVAGKVAEGAAVDHARLAQRLDRRRPCATFVAVAIFDLDRHPGRACLAGPTSWPGEDRDATERLHPGL